MSDFAESVDRVIERVHDLANDGKFLFAAWEIVVITPNSPLSMLPERRTTRLLIPLLLVLAFTAMSVISGDVSAEDNQRQDAELFGGKTLDEWITQANQGRRLEDRNESQ